MLIEAVDHPIRYRFPGGEIRLEPGQPVEVEPERAAKLLARAGAKVRAITPTIQPQPGDRITWGASGTPRGPATVDFLHTDPDGTGWAFVTLSPSWVAVNTKVVTHIEPGERHVHEAD